MEGKPLRPALRGACNEWNSAAELFGRFEFGVHLPDKSIRSRSNLGDLGIEIGSHMRSDHFLRRLPVLNHFCDAFSNRENHVPVGDHGSSVNHGAVTWN